MPGAGERLGEMTEVQMRSNVLPRADGLGAELTRTVEHIVAGLAEAAGIESEVTPHSFRHGLATELVRRRVRESTVKTILGHASPATTRIYVHKSAVEVADEYQDAFGPYRPPRDSVAD